MASIDQVDQNARVGYNDCPKRRNRH
jgi:hypothetical protein